MIPRRTDIENPQAIAPDVLQTLDLRSASANSIGQNPAESRVFLGRTLNKWESLCGSRLHGGGTSP